MVRLDAYTMDFVNIGEDITITRSDGRVQSAKVDEIREDCVTVTWTEDFKVMGKEIVWANVLELNPHLIERAQQGGEYVKVNNVPDFGNESVAYMESSLDEDE